MFVSQAHVLGVGRTGSQDRLERKLRFVSGIECAPHDGVTVIESHLAGGNTAHLRGDTVPNLVADDHVSQKPIFCRWAEINGLPKDLVQMLRSEPPLRRWF